MLDAGAAVKVEVFYKSWDDLGAWSPFTPTASTASFVRSPVATGKPAPSTDLALGHPADPPMGIQPRSSHAESVRRMPLWDSGMPQAHDPTSGRPPVASDSGAAPIGRDREERAATRWSWGSGLWAGHTGTRGWGVHHGAFVGLCRFFSGSGYVIAGARTKDEGYKGSRNKQNKGW